MSVKIQSLELSEINQLGPHDMPGDIVVVDKAPHVTVLSLCVQNGVKHVVQKSHSNSQAEIQVSNLMMTVPEHFFQFPLSCILGASLPSPTSEKKFSGVSHVVEKFSDRRVVLSEVESYIKGLSSSPALLTDILSVVDETLTNAVFNAPFAAGSKPTKASRDVVDFPIDPVKKPAIFAGHDQERIIVGCRDQYGSLNIENLIHRIKSCYEKNVGEMINFGEGGAGIGSFLMFNSCISMYIGVDSGVSTTICCSFPLKLSATTRSAMPKNIHLIHR